MSYNRGSSSAHSAVSRPTKSLPIIDEHFTQKTRKKYNQGVEFVAPVFRILQGVFAYTGNLGEVELDVEV